MDRTLKRFWEVDSYGSEAGDPIVCTEDEKIALQKVSGSINYNNGKYCIAVPWKEQRPTLLHNRQMALSRLCNTEQNLRKNAFV